MKILRSRVGSHVIGGEELFFIVEEGNANDGNFEKALQMIDLAAECGANAIEFQLAIASDFYVRNDPGYERYKKREFSEIQIKELVKRASQNGIEFIAAILSHNLIESVVNAGCAAITVNSSDLNNPAIIDVVAKSGKPILLSILLASEDEIKWALTRLKNQGATNIILLHGQHIMASGGQSLSPDNTSLGCIDTLRVNYDMPVGFIDHTSYKWMPACATAAGAVVVTKHLIPSRKDKGPDWFICLEPEEMKDAILWANMLYRSKKNTQKFLAPGENDDRPIMRRSIVASKSLIAGKILEFDDLCFKRPGTGLEPSNYEQLIGKRINRDIEYDEQIQLSDLKRE